MMLLVYLQEKVKEHQFYTILFSNHQSTSKLTENLVLFLDGMLRQLNQFQLVDDPLILSFLGFKPVSTDEQSSA